jgi:hypothetical protein
MRIIATVKLQGGRLLTAANADKIFAQKLTPSDRWGNRLGKPVGGGYTDYQGRPCEAYFQKWKIHKDEKGFCWREVSHGSGICGYAGNVRELVIKTLFGFSSDIVVEVEEGGAK